MSFTPTPKPSWKVLQKELFTGASDDSIDLLSKLLVFDPLKRLSATQVIGMDGFNLMIDVVMI